jgi:hypothetical protein
LNVEQRIHKASVEVKKNLFGEYRARRGWGKTLSGGYEAGHLAGRRVDGGDEAV